MSTYDAGNISVYTLAIITVVTSTSSKHPFFILGNACNLWINNKSERH